MKITNISVSRKGVWDQCVQLYKYQYHLGLPSPEPTPFYFVYGRIVHVIAELQVKYKGEKSLADICRDVLEGRIPIEKDKQGNDVYAPPLEPEYKKRFPDHIKALHRLSERIGLEGITEYEFKYDLNPPHGNYVVGFIDRIIKKDGKFFILDYKTSKKNFYRKTASNISKDLQLRIYARIIQKENNVKPEDITAGLYYVEGPELIAARFCEASLVKAEEELLYAYNQIQQTPEEKAWGNVGDHCKRCLYKKLCPFYSLT